MRDISIYIHIPFCVRKCLYCDFLSFPISGENEKRVAYSSKAGICETLSGKAEAKGKLSARDESVEKMSSKDVENYVNLLAREIEQQSIFYKKHRVISIFFGGGTPSLLTAGQIREIMDRITTHYTLSEAAEITMEMNPGTVTEAKLREYITCGINRISIGLQSADNEELARIGRIHDYETFLQTYRMARSVGFTNINIDLMSALPGQSLASYRNTLERVAALEPEHISAYSLILEEGTPLYVRQADYSFPDEEEDRRMYLMTGSYLAEHGYHRYEISNYAREGYECRHNKVYWQRGDYVGFGLGAASMVEECRWSNPTDLEQYAAYVRNRCALSRQEVQPILPEPLKQTVQTAQTGCPEQTVQSQQLVRQGQTAQVVCPKRHRLTVPEQMEEFMFLGLRMMCGVERDAFYRKFGQPIEEVYGSILDKLGKQGLLVEENDRIRLTDRGIDVSNYVMAEFLFD